MTPEEIKNLFDRDRYFRRDGTPYPRGEVGLLEWARDHQKDEIRRVAVDDLPNGVRVSTVWLGLDHNFGFNNRPLIFETMLFVADHQDINILGIVFKKHQDSIGEQWRYSTEEEALRGHKMLVKKWSMFKTADQVLESLKSNELEQDK